MITRACFACRVLVVAGLMAGPVGANPDPVLLRVAAASNLTFVSEKLGAEFMAHHPHVRIEFSHAASGNLVAQIRHGAPFDVLLAADLAYPAALIESGHSAMEKPQVFATGILMLWPKPAETDVARLLRSPQTRRLAIAHPDIAPYGSAARDWLRANGLWADVSPKVVMGENVAQTLQFVASGHAEIGFIAASLLAANPDLGKGWEVAVPATTLAHGAIPLRRSAHPEAAARFLAWLASPPAQEILAANGYRAP